MQSEWRIATIGDLVALQRGFDLPSQERKAGLVPIMGSAGISGYHDKASTTGPGVVIGRSGVGSMGVTSFIDRDFWALNTTLFVTDFKGNDIGFIYHLLKSIDFRHLNSGSAQASLNRNVVYPIKVAIPASVEEQRAISRLLSGIDQRIALLRRSSAILESIAQTLFKSWFIDFDPIRAKAEGFEPEGMDAATAALFPATFESAAPGALPQGWTTNPLADFATLARGTVNPLNFPDTTFDHYSLPAFDVDQLPVRELGGAIKSNKTRVPEGSVLLSKLNPHIPRVWFPGRIGELAVCSTEFLPWVARSGASPEFIYCVLRSEEFTRQMQTLVTGTSNSHQRVKPEQVATLSVVGATAAVRAAFTDLVRPVLRKVVEQRRQARALAEVRDALRPRLISGKLRLPECQEKLRESIA